MKKRTTVIAKTKHLVIRRFRMDDIDNLYLLLSDPDVMRYLEPPFDRDKTVSFLKSAALCAEPLIYAVNDVDGFAGYVIWHPWGGSKDEEDIFELGWVLKREYWHRGYAGELTEFLLREKHRAVVIECTQDQTASKKIAIHSGFRYIGYVDGCDVFRKDGELT